MNGLGEILLSLFEKPEGNSKDNPENGQWILVKDKEKKQIKICFVFRSLWINFRTFARDLRASLLTLGHRCEHHGPRLLAALAEIN